MSSNGESVPKIVLIPHSRSHPFAQRECVLSEPLKVGRPVDKKKISQNNLIFDCRVLSRNHALIWFENGKFFIKDTKSSNGTFVNECRLSPSGEESSPTEMRTRDIVQFGVNVNVEKKVTHGCIIATVKLFIDDKELPGPDPDIQQVMSIIQSALLREQEIETKLACMQEVLVVTHNLANDSMISIVKEDELLSRLEMLENQLQVYSKNITEDELRKQLVASFEEKHKKEIIAKETIQTMLQEKISTTSKLSQLQRDYDKAEEECQRYRTLYDSLKHEHSQQVTKLNDAIKAAEKQKLEDDNKSKEERDLLQIEIETVRNELELTRLRLKETADELLEVKEKLENIDKQSMNIINHEVTEDSNVQERVNEVALMDVNISTNLLASNDIKEEADATIHDVTTKSDLKIAQSKVSHLTEELGTLNKAHLILQSQVEELKVQLHDKELLEERKAAAARDLKMTIEYQKNEIEKLKNQLKAKEVPLSDVTDLPSELEQCQGQLLEMRRHSELTEERLREKETEISFIIQEKNSLEDRLSSLKQNHTNVLEESRRNEAQLQLELNEAQSEAKSLTSQLQLLQETLSESLSPNLASSSEVSLLEAPPSPDTRIKILSIITLVSIAVALISTAFAYFF
ncbi:PREDICTED: sarcolemmal membrane-associated protein-like [Amphimedon queenslandica]|nr:PREDICTED: sarcolemmal membrane-associated protein-like [Amphimedon queenslandica]|eukprot:XP_019848758.1 PREDICTED: sarcolemmal membrane-associated protein-like [Amphimedon queenslandica]